MMISARSPALHYDRRLRATAAARSLPMRVELCGSGDVLLFFFLEILDHVAKEGDHSLPLRMRRGAPFVSARFLVRDLELQSRQRGRVVVRVQFAHVLVRQHVPVVRRADGNARAFRSSAGAAFGDRVADLPKIGSDLLFLPLALVVVPLVTAA